MSLFKFILEFGNPKVVSPTPAGEAGPLLPGYPRLSYVLDIGTEQMPFEIYK